MHIDESCTVHMLSQQGLLNVILKSLDHFNAITKQPSG